MDKSFYLSILIFVSVTITTEANTWDNLINKTHDWSESVSDFLRKKYVSIGQSVNVSSECDQSIWKTLDGIKDVELWAIRLINSWGSFPPSGILVGTSTDFGSYDQCLEIEPNDVLGEPQYCLIDIIPPIPRPMPVHHNLHHRVDVLPVQYINNTQKTIFESHSEFASFYYWISLRTGICVPSKCSSRDITALTKHFAETNGLELRQVQCQTTNEPNDLFVIQIITFSFLFVIFVATSAATIKDQNPSSDQSLFVDTFSMKRNIMCLFGDRITENLSCIHGIRVLTITWIIIGHTIEWTNYQLFGRAFLVKEHFAKIINHVFLNVYFSVDTFFFISGLLTSYITLQTARGKLSGFSSLGFFVSKYIRLTPQLVVFILLTFLIPLGGWASGPVWKESVGPTLDNCSVNWWRNLLYIQNMFKSKEMCGLHTWFLAADMQYHWMSLIFLVPVLYKVKLGYAITLSAIIIFYVSSIIISYYLDLPPGLLNTGRDEHFYKYFFDQFYMKPWSHFTVFFIGFMLGVALYKGKFRRINLAIRNLIVFLILMGYMVCLMDTYYWSSGRPHKALLSGLIYATCRVIWSLSTAALIWLCVSGNGGIINAILSAKVLTPLSRLTYSVYLTHAWVVWSYVGTRRQHIDANWTDISFILIHNIIISYFIGFLFAVIFEFPVIKLQKRLKEYLYERAGNSKIEDNINHTNNTKV